jgi:hypothetical protein
MAYVVPVGAGGTPGQTVTRCFNSQLPAAVASTPPCGFIEGEPTTGNVTIDFGFQVNDRFVSVTGRFTQTVISTCSSSDQGCGGLSNRQIYVLTQNWSDGKLSDEAFAIFVY